MLNIPALSLMDPVWKPLLKPLKLINKTLHYINDILSVYQFVLQCRICISYIRKQ